MFTSMILGPRLLRDPACDAADVAEYIETDRVVWSAMARSQPVAEQAYAAQVGEKNWNLTMQSYQMAANDSEFGRFYPALTWVGADLDHALVLYDEPGAYPASARHSWYLERCYLPE